MTLQGPVVALAAQGHLLAAVWHSASPSNTDDQCLHYAVFDVSQQQQVSACFTTGVLAPLHADYGCAPSAMSPFGAWLCFEDLLGCAHLMHILQNSCEWCRGQSMRCGVGAAFFVP